MKGVKKEYEPFNLERILSGKDPMRESWYIGSPCVRDHGVDGRNVRYHGRQSCVACNLIKTGRGGHAAPRVQCMGEGCEKMMKIGTTMCKACRVKARNGTGVDFDWHKEDKWDCFAAGRGLQMWVKNHAERLGE